MASRASSALASVYWLARAAPRHKLNEGLAARFEHGCLPGEILPAHHCDVDISRMKLDRVAAAGGHFRCDNCGAGADERIVNRLPRRGIVLDRALHALDGLLSRHKHERVRSGRNLR